MKKISLTLTALLITLIILQGCDESSTDPNNDVDNNQNNEEQTTSEKIIGSWSKTIENDEIQTIIIEFTENGNYKATSSNSDKDILLGNYEINGDVISMFDEDCGLDIEGKYELSFHDNIVNFKLVSDDCDRSGKVTGDWTEYKE